MTGLHQILTEIERHRINERAIRLQDGIGRLRGGNAGFVLPDGRSAMSCPRKAILRTFFGIEEPSTIAKQFIFDHGLSTEWQLVQDLEAWCKRSGLTANTQSEAGIRLITKKGTPITGSPDFVAYDDKGKPVFGIEMKSMSSAYKAMQVLAEYAGADAVCQAALYSHGLGKIPWSLVYTSQTQHHNVKQLFGVAPMWDEPRCKHLFDFNGKGEPKSLLGFRQVFDISWENDTVLISFGGMFPDGDFPDNKPREQLLRTVISIPAIMEFYDRCDDAQGKTWPVPPVSVDIVGKAKSFRVCDYCGFNKQCSKVGKTAGACVAKLAEEIQRGNNS